MYVLYLKSQFAEVYAFSQEATDACVTSVKATVAVVGGLQVFNQPQFISASSSSKTRFDGMTFRDSTVTSYLVTLTTSSFTATNVVFENIVQSAVDVYLVQAQVTSTATISATTFTNVRGPLLKSLSSTIITNGISVSGCEVASSLSDMILLQQSTGTLNGLTITNSKSPLRS